MGAGNCPKETEAQLLHEALKLNLGFSESQLSRAIKHLVKEFGSLEDASAWIRQDNFTILVNYILDNGDTESSQPRAESSPVCTEQVRKSGIEQKKKGGKPLPLSKDVQNGPLPGRNAPPTDDSISNKVDQQKDSSLRHKGRFDRQAMRSHFSKKLPTNQVKTTHDSVEYEVSAKTLSTQFAHTNTGNSLSKQARLLSDQVEHLSPMMPKVVPMQRLNALSRNEDHSRTKKRGQGLNGSVSTSQKKGKVFESEAAKQGVWESRALMPSGCEELATGQGSYQAVRKDNADLRGSSPSEKRTPIGKSPAHEKIFQAEVVTKQSVKRKESANGSCAAVEKRHVFVDLDTTNNILGTSIGVERKDTCYPTRKADIHGAELLPSSAEQRASCSALDKSVAVVEKDVHAEGVFLEQLEASLKEGNCHSALEVLKAWKLKRQQVGTRLIEENFSGEGVEMMPDVPGRKKGFVVSYDISRGLEKLPITCVNEYNTDVLPENFLYVTRSVIRQAAHVDISFSRIGDLHCCCSDDCLRSSEPCKCTDSTRGEYAYDENGRLIERLAIGFVSGCTTINGDFITECCDKCRCSMKCGNRVVQRGITKKLQVFMTSKKGWGVRALEKISARSFIFEYLGEIATNSEQYDRNLEYAENGVYTYVMGLDADLDMERKHFKEGLNDHEALVLDATIFGNVSRFVNHRCNDANLFMRPVQIETRDTHYYHAALFAARDIEEMEELTWDYGIDFDDDTHLLKAFKCHCKSSSCRDRASQLKQDKAKKRKLVKPSW